MLKSFTTLKNDEITSIAIGGFDGIHLGHQELIKKLDNKGVGLVIDKGFSTLTPGNIKCKYFNNGCIFLDLKDIKNLTPIEFIKFLKQNFPSLKRVIVGYDFSFGKDKSGNAQFLSKFFDTVVVKEVIVDGVSVHSKVIREYLKKGDIKKVNKLLGRAYSIRGKKVCGQGLGSKELVSTINIQNNIGFLLPKDGVYATKTKVDNKWYISATFIGNKKSIDGSFSIETHLINEKIESIKKEEIEIEFYDFIRDNKKFATLKELKKQILKDIKKIKDTFENK